MTITTEHPASSYGVPVILADDGTIIDTGTGIRAVRESLNLSRDQFAAALRISKRTVEAWEYGRAQPAGKRIWQIKEMVEARESQGMKLKSLRTHLNKTKQRE